MSERKLASVRRISAIEPIEGADKIVLARVDGWQLVTAKDNGFNVGDLCVYFEIDSFLPVCPEFEFLRKACFKSTPNLGDGFRLRTIRLRKQLSQGLIIPLEKSDDGNWMLNHSLYGGLVYEGQDLTAELNVQKFERPIPPQLVGTVKGNFPSFIRKTDQERVQNLTNKELDQIRGASFEQTLKLDGSSMTVYYKDGEVGVCSRNLDLKYDPNNTFWATAEKAGLIDVLKQTRMNLALQGELMGPGVQGNREGFTEHRFYLFDIWDIDKQDYWNPVERDGFVRTAEAQTSVQIEHAPVLGITDVFVKALDIQHVQVECLQQAENLRSVNHPIAEGIVFKRMDGQFSFKAISNRFLEKGGE